MKYLLSLFTLLLITLSCEPKVLFKNPLPPEGEVLDSIPLEYRGVYYSECDSTVLHAMADVLYTDSYFQFITTLTRFEEEEGCRIADGGLYLRGTKECVPFEYLGGDTIKVKLHQKDTMFYLSDQQVAKLYKGHLFLNHKDERGNWIASRVTREANGHLNWELIDVPDKLDKIKEITTDYSSYVRKDSEEIFVINPTQIEFEKLLSKDYLKECDVFIPYSMKLPF